MQLICVLPRLRLVYPNAVARLVKVSTRAHTHRELFTRPRAATRTREVGVCGVGQYYSTQPGSCEDGVLIYTGSLAKAVRGVKLFSYSSSMFSVCLMPFILTQTGIGMGTFAVKMVFCGFVGFFTFLTPVLLHLLTRGYVVRLYHRRETDVYTAITYSALLLEKRMVFHQRDVRLPNVSRMFTSFYAMQRPLLVNPDLFQLPHDYNHLMGYDQPFSFSLDEIQRPDKNKE